MKILEDLGILKIDILGLKTLSQIQNTMELVDEHEGERIDPNRIPFDDDADLRSFPPRADRRHLSGGKLRHARCSQEDRPDDVRGRDRHQRALSPRSPRQRHGERFHRMQARPQKDRVRGSAARADSRGDVRRHPVSGAGHADRLRSRRLHPRGGRHSAPRDGEEEEGGDGEEAPRLHRRSARRGTSRKRKRSRSSISSTSSPGTDSTSPTRPPTRSSRYRPRTSRRTIQRPSWRPP